MIFEKQRKNMIELTLVLSCFCATATADDKSTSDKPKKEKKETKYDKLFKDKKRDTAASKFITLHKTDGKLYLELPLKYLKQQMLLSGAVSSSTDPTYVAVGMKNSNPLYFYFDIQDSSVVMKTPNTVLYNNGKESNELKDAFSLSYRDPILTGFKIEAYNNDSTAVVYDATSLLGRPNSLLQVMPSKSGDFVIKSSPKSEMSYIRAIKSFDKNIIVNADFNYSVTATLMSLPIASDIPTTVGVTYSLALMPNDKMRARIADSRVGVASSSKITFSNEIAKSRLTYLAHRWNLVPANKKAYSDGKGSKPVQPIRFYLDNTFPEAWKEPIKKGVLLWNKAFEKIGYKDVLEIVDFPTDDPKFDPENSNYSCIRYVLNGSEMPTSNIWVNPANGEILNASLFIYSNVGDLLHKWRFIGTSASDASVRSNELPANKFAEGLSYLVAREIGHTLGLLDNLGASWAYSVDNLRNAAFTQANGLSASIMDDAHFNYVAQPQDKGVLLAPKDLGAYDYHAIEWNYRYFDPEKVSIESETKQLEALVDQRVKNPAMRYYRTQSQRWDPRVQEGSIGNDPIKAGNEGIKNLQIVEKNLYNWVKNDEDSRIKEKLYLAIAQQHYAYFKHTMSNVGGIYLNDMKQTSGVPRYQVVPKAKQRESLLWCLAQAKRFKSYANKDFEKRGFMSISYYDQLLEFIGYDLMGARTRVAVASHLDPNSYTQKEYFADLYNSIFQSAMKGVAPTQEERVLQRTYLTYSLSIVDKANKSGSNGPAALKESNTAINLSNDYGYGDPNASLAPTIDAALIDNSALYFYSSLLQLKPLLENCLKAKLSDDAKSHYQMLLFRVNKALEDGK